MVTKEEVDKAWESWDELNLVIYEECLLCKKSYLWCKLLIKIPESVSLCEECAKKHKDNKKYWGKLWGRYSYIIGEWFIDLPYVNRDENNTPWSR